MPTDPALRSARSGDTPNLDAALREPPGPNNPANADPALALADRLQQHYGERITARIVQPARPARHAPFPSWLNPALVAALQQRGVAQLYSHQAEALAHVQAGRNLVVVTPTASGKSLCYNLPVLHGVQAEGAKALYLFPTKALAQDQVAELNELNRQAGLAVRAFTFDGDTPADARQAVRLKGDIVVSNPDMLHQGILPHHTKWAQFFEGLRYVVIDEMHTYRGIFGSHVANVLRRLRRVAAFYGSHPQFILCSATLANPVQLAEGLIGQAVSAVDRNGAPSGERHLLLWNPPVINPDLGIRASNRSQTTRIARMAVQQGLKTIVFANSRLMVEVLTKYLKDAFERDIQPRAHISAYRGGYLPNERRRTEQALRGDQVDCVVATSALELGVDIGSLDVCILNGYPGSIAGTWQRLGRAGRRGRAALGVLVASSDALDQDLVRNPEFFDAAPVEHGRIAPDQLLILMEHLRCAAFELPFRRGELFGEASVDEHLAYLAEQGVLHLEADRWHWMSDSYPANAVSLRSVADGNFLVIDQTDQRKEVLAEVDYSAAAMTLYEGAIYLVQAQPYQVEHLDWVGRKAFVRATRVDYYTDAIDYTHLGVPSGKCSRPASSRSAENVRAFLGLAAWTVTSAAAARVRRFVPPPRRLPLPPPCEEQRRMDIAEQAVGRGALHEVRRMAAHVEAPNGKAERLGPARLTPTAALLLLRDVVLAVVVPSPRGHLGGVVVALQRLQPLVRRLCARGLVHVAEALGELLHAAGGAVGGSRLHPAIGFRRCFGGNQIE